MENDVQFIDAEAYQGGFNKEISFRMIVLEHLRKIGGYASIEFRGGFFEERTTNEGGKIKIIRTYIPDSREVYSNAIEYLYDILLPHFDKEMIKRGEQLEKEKENFYNYYTKAEALGEDDGTIIEDRYFKETDNKLAFRNKKREINRVLLQAICSFLKRNNYMESKYFTDEIK